MLKFLIWIHCFILSHVKLPKHNHVKVFEWDWSKSGTRRDILILFFPQDSWNHIPISYMYGWFHEHWKVVRKIAPSAKGRPFILIQNPI